MEQCGIHYNGRHTQCVRHMEEEGTDILELEEVSQMVLKGDS